MHKPSSFSPPSLFSHQTKNPNFIPQLKLSFYCCRLFPLVFQILVRSSPSGLLVINWDGLHPFSCGDFRDEMWQYLTMSPTIPRHSPPPILIQPLPSPDDLFQKWSQIDHWSLLKYNILSSPSLSHSLSLCTFCSIILTTKPYHTTYRPTSIRVPLRSTHSRQNDGCSFRTSCLNHPFVMLLPALQQSRRLSHTPSRAVSRLQQVWELRVALLSPMHTTKPKQWPLHLNLLRKGMVFSTVRILPGLGSNQRWIAGLDSAHYNKNRKIIH